MPRIADEARATGGALRRREPDGELADIADQVGAAAQAARREVVAIDFFGANGREAAEGDRPASRAACSEGAKP